MVEPKAETLFSGSIFIILERKKPCNSRRPGRYARKKEGFPMQNDQDFTIRPADVRDAAALARADGLSPAAEHKTLAGAV